MGLTTAVAPGGTTYAAPLLVLGVPASVAVPFLGIPLVFAGLFVLYFYRDPARKAPPSGVVAPADGTVASLRWDTDAEGRDRIRVGIYLGPGDVHVIRSPFGGTVRHVDRESGGHWPAQIGRSDRNEKVHVRFDGATVTMIVGVFARRVRPYVAADQELSRGERIGHIAFGSRTDLLLPPEVGPEDLTVEPGESVRAGESVLVRAEAVESGREIAL
jgi:phosphatidylserine decarboxylase